MSRLRTSTRTPRFAGSPGFWAWAPDSPSHIPAPRKRAGQWAGAPGTWAEAGWESQEPGNQRYCGPGPTRTHTVADISGQGFSQLLGATPTLFPDPVNQHPVTVPWLECTTSTPAEAWVPRSFAFQAPSWGLPAGQGRGRSCPESDWGRGGEPPPQPACGVQSWLSPKGPPSLSRSRSLRPALLGPAPLSGVRARAGAGRGGVSYRIWGGWGFSTAALQTLAGCSEGPSPYSSRRKNSRANALSFPGCGAWSRAQMPLVPLASSPH